MKPKPDPKSTRLAGLDGSLKKHEEGQDTGSGVNHPCLKKSHYVHPRGAGITITISCAELAALATAINHGYSHVATDSLTSMHPNSKAALTPRPPPPPNPGRRPPIHSQRKPPVTIAHSLPQSQIPCRYLGNEHADAVARKLITIYSDVADISITKTAGPEGNPFYNIYKGLQGVTTFTGLQTNMKFFFFLVGVVTRSSARA